MRKYILTALFFLSVILFGINAQDKKEIREKNIKTITVYEEKVEKNKKEIVESVTTYDKNGNELELIEYNSEGKFKKHFKWKYNSDFQKIKEIELDESGDIIETTEYKYQNGLKSERTVFNGKGEVLEKKRYVYTYN